MEHVIMLRVWISERHDIITMAVKPFVGNWPLLQFLEPIHRREESLGEWSARLKAATYTQNNTSTEKTHIMQTSIPWVGLEPTIPAFDREKTIHVLDRATTLIGSFKIYCT
jgi:hypothetical protein